MSVTDHGLEAIRKSAHQVDGSSIEYKIKTFSVSGMLSETYDAVAVTYPSATQEVYAFKTGGLAGTTVATVTINYTDSTKVNLLNVVKT